jgi:fibronectin-binding autotransporter adhesin
LLPGADALALGGGVLQVIGGSNAASSQPFVSTALTAGSSTISAAPVAGAFLPTVSLGAVGAKAGAVVEFAGPATVGSGGASVGPGAVITAASSGNGAFMGGNGAAFFDAIFATVGLYDFAAATVSAPFTVVGGSQVAGFYTAASGTAGTFGNLDVIGNITGWSGQPYLTSLRFNTGLGANISVAAYSTLTLDDILVTPNVGAFNVSINNNNLRPGGGSSSYAGPYVIWQNNTGGELLLNSYLGNSKVGAAAYVQAGPGTVSITGSGSGFTGQSYLNGGFTLISADGSIGFTPTNSAVNLDGGTLVANGTFAMDNGGSALRPFNLLGSGGGLAAIAGNRLTVDGVIASAAGAGPLTIGVPASAANNNTPGLLPGTGPGTANAAVYATGTVILTNANSYSGGTRLSSGTLNINGINALGGANFGGLVFDGGTLQYAAAAAANNGSADLTSIGTGITLAAGGGAIDVNGNSVTYAGSMGNGGAGALIVISSTPGGILDLLGANLYSGKTTVSNATLRVDNASGSATGSGDVFLLNNASLGGTGALAGSVTVESGATIMPAGPAGGLALGADLSLLPGSTAWMQIQHSPMTNTTISPAGTLNAGGALIVTNIGATALANGDTFQLFNASAYAGSFTALVLPALATNLWWNTNNLPTSGTLSVVALSSPAIAGVQLAGPDLIVSGSGGVSRWGYVVLSSTNLAGIGGWVPVATNQFNRDGTFMLTLTNAVDPDQPQTFYKLRLQ